MNEPDGSQKFKMYSSINEKSADSALFFVCIPVNVIDAAWLLKFRETINLAIKTHIHG
ncbi:MAG: hypothetical protein K0Q73_4113 [Paenibacillus sp.]|jgi:hypothetical protein|nr:hypothetical protein [Paenibacillus sp.]